MIGPFSRSWGRPLATAEVGGRPGGLPHLHSLSKGAALAYLRISTQDRSRGFARRQFCEEAPYHSPFQQTGKPLVTDFVIVGFSNERAKARPE